MPPTVKELMEMMPEKYKKGVFFSEKSIYITLGDEPDLKWTIFAGPDSVRVEKGKAIDNADCVFKTSPELFVKIALGQYTPGMMDFMRGKLKTSDPDILMKFKEAMDFSG